MGGIQNTVTNLGASLGTALVGAVLISSLTAGLVHGVSANPAIPPEVIQKATIELSSGVPFISDTELDEPPGRGRRLPRGGRGDRRRERQRPLGRPG